jgi:hypothetical protein
MIKRGFMYNKYLNRMAFLLVIAVLPTLSFASPNHAKLDMYNDTNTNMKLWTYSTNNSCINLNVGTGTRLSAHGHLNQIIHINSTGGCSESAQYLIVNFEDQNTSHVLAGYRFEIKRNVAYPTKDCYSKFHYWMTSIYDSFAGPGGWGTVDLHINVNDNRSKYDSQGIHYCK